MLDDLRWLRYNFIRGSNGYGSSCTNNMWRLEFMRELNTSSFTKNSQFSSSASQYIGRPNSLYRIQHHYASLASREKKSRKMLLYLTALTFFMVGSSYAAVPLYRRFCQATGYGGTVQRREVWLGLFFGSIIF